MRYKERADVLTSGKLKPVIDSVLDVGDVRKTYEKLLSRQFFGKFVVRV